jgi:uncharacterized protein YndB with AHSA1/START domain
MFQVIVIIAIILAVIIAAVLIMAATKPDRFSVQRATVINAPAEKVFPLIADFHEWRKWSPWEDRDPDLKRTYGGAERGKGAIYAWEGNRNVGSGRMEILEANSPSLVKIQLDFLKPFEAHNIAEFTILPQGNATHLSWMMSGPARFVSKVMQVFMSFDRMIGKDFEAGLAKIKSVSER